VQSEGLTVGRVHGGEHPHFSAEWTDSAWAAITQELGPALAAARRSMAGSVRGSSARCAGTGWRRPRLRMRSGSGGAARGLPLSKLIGGVQERIACGVSLGIQASIPELLAVIEKELAAGISASS